jgi:hypothetical protein
MEETHYKKIIVALREKFKPLWKAELYWDL